MSCERSYIYFLSETLVWDFIIVILKFLVVYLSDFLIEAKNRKSSSQIIPFFLSTHQHYYPILVTPKWGLGRGGLDMVLPFCSFCVNWMFSRFKPVYLALGCLRTRLRAIHIILRRMRLYILIEASHTEPSTGLCRTSQVQFQSSSSKEVILGCTLYEKLTFLEIISAYEENKTCSCVIYLSRSWYYVRLLLGFNIILHGRMPPTMCSSSNGAAFRCKGKVKSEIIGSMPIGCMRDL